MTRVYLSPDKTKIVVEFPYDPALIGALRRVPGMRFDKPTKTWRGPLTRPTGRGLWKALNGRCSWHKEVTEALQAIPKSKPASEVVIPELLKGKLSLPFGSPQPFEFQRKGIAFGLENPRILIADEVGCGKSGQAVLAAEFSGCKKTLIVCPKYLIPNWNVELGKWTDTQAMVVTADSEELELDKDEFLERLRDARYCITNYDMLKRFKNAFNHKWDCVIGDECHYLKNRDSIRSRQFKKLKSNRVILLSGTPFLNRPIELWSILDYLGQGEFGNYYEFGDLYGGGGVKEIPMGVFCPDCNVRRATMKGTCFSCGSTESAKRKTRTVKMYDGASNLDDLKGRLEPFMIARKKSEVLSELPDYQRIDRLIELPTDSRTKYDVAMADLIKYLIKFRKKTPDAAVRSAFSEAMRRGAELRQILSESKVEIAADEIYQVLAKGERAIAFVCYKNTAEALAKAIRNLDNPEKAFTDPVKVFVHTGDYSDADRALAIQNFRETPGSVLICTIQSAGVGLNLTEARYGFFLDLPWTPADVFQAEGRLHRIGQKQEVTYIRYFAAGTYDEKMMEKLKTKQAHFDHLIGKSEDVKIEADVTIDNLFASYIRDTIEGLKLQEASLPNDKDTPES